MSLAGPGRLHNIEKSRTLIYVSQTVANDSAFPFEDKDELVITIDQKAGRLVIEKASK